VKRLLLASMLFPSVAFAGDADYSMVIVNHRFQPAEITIPAGKKVRLMIENRDATPEEFDSYELNREKVVAGNSRAMIYIGPLEPGRYPFSGEFHADTAQGAIIAQ
jgi:Cupredoxin-like domain